MEQIIDDFQEVQTKPFNHAGFGIRFAAMFIDLFILFVISAVLNLIIGIPHYLFPGASNLIPVLINLVYFASFESSSGQATLGKVAVGIYVGKENGERISFLNAAGRFFAKFISTITLFIGFLMVIWNPEKQGLHDKLASTYVFLRANQD